MRVWGAAALLFANTLAVAANPADTASADTAGIAEFVPDGARVEARIDADLTGDGSPDVAYVATGEESRHLMVLARFTVDAAPGQPAYDGLEPVDSLTLELTPLGAASLAVKKGVLVVDVLTGGTTATATTYRYRFDANEDRMRLIGLDTERYSRTNSHGAIKLSWNLLTGVRLLQRSAPDASEEAYRYSKEQRTVRKTEAIYMAETPDVLIDAEVPPPNEDRRHTERVFCRSRTAFRTVRRAVLAPFGAHGPASPHRPNG